MISIEIADMHWGVRNPEHYYYEMHNFIISKLSRMGELDIIFIAGDIFDSKQYLYSQTMVWFVKFYKELLYEARMLDAKIIIIEGTKTHDSLQYSIVHDLFNGVYESLFPYDDQDPSAYMNFEVGYTNKVSEYNYYCESDDYEYKILLIPEEYIADQESYYKPYFENKHYNIIVGHGMIDKIWYAKSKKEEKQEGVLGTPVFNVKDFGTLATRTYFGHVHQHKYYGDDTGFTYIGPPSAWEFLNSVKDYGFILTEFDKGKFVKDEFIINIDAPIYDTKGLVIDQDYKLEDLNNRLDNMIQTAIKNGVYRLCIAVNMDSSLPTFLTMRDFIITKLSNEPMVKLILNNKVGSGTITTEVTPSGYDDIDYTDEIGVDISSPIPNQVKDFITKRSGKVIDTEVIKEWLDSED